MRRLSLFKASIIGCSIVCQSAATPAPVDFIASPSAIFEALALNRDLPTPERPKYLSPTDMVASPDGKLLFVAEQTEKRIDVAEVASGLVTGRIALPNEVTGLAIAPDGRTLYATCSSDRWPAGMVCVIDPAGRKVMGRIPVGYGACAPVITPDGAKLYVCNRFDNNISVVNVSSGSVAGLIRAVREPCCAAVTPDGRNLIVGNRLPSGLSTDTGYIDPATSSRISFVDVTADTVVAEVRMSRGSTNVAGIAISPDGKFAFVTHQIANYHIIATTVEKGRLHTNNIAVIDIADKRFVNDLCLDHSITGMADPWSIRFSGDGTILCVSHAGTGQLSIIDFPAMLDTVLAHSARQENMQRDFTALDSLRRDVATGVACPRALTIVNGAVYTAGYFSDASPTVRIIDLALGKVATGQIVLDEPRQPTARRQGEASIYDANLCFQRWQSCHSCHSGGRGDGLNWILGGGAIVAPKNTKSFVYSWWTPPTTWAGRRGHAQQAIIAGVELELFRVPTREITAPIDTFFMSMQPVQSPLRVKGRLSGAAQRGRTLFYDTAKTGCRTCHPAPLFTDNLSWNAGVPDPFDANLNWNTPTLAEIWRTAPYNHLGGLRIRDMVALPTMSSKVTDLSSQEIDDLVEYVLSL